MGLRLKIEGNESIHLPETSIITVQFGADIPHDSNARSTDLGSTVFIRGKILAAVNDCYRNVQIDVISASQVVRQITVPNAFVVDYEEDFTDDTGAGTFKLLLKQKKDKMVNLKFEGGFSGE